MKTIVNEKGQVIARIHGTVNTGIIAKFMIKNNKRTPKLKG